MLDSEIDVSIANAPKEIIRACAILQSDEENFGELIHIALSRGTIETTKEEGAFVDFLFSSPSGLLNVELLFHATGIQKVRITDTVQIQFKFRTR